MFEAASGGAASQAMHLACCLSGFLKFFVRGISHMKKIAVSLVLASAMALAACSGAEEATTEAAEGAEATWRTGQINVVRRSASRRWQHGDHRGDYRSD